MATSQLAIIYETLLAVPGMNDNVKIDLKIPRKTVLLFTEVMRRGMEKGDSNSNYEILSKLSGEAITELNAIINDSLEKAGLTELSIKLKSLSK